MCPMTPISSSATGRVRSSVRAAAVILLRFAADQLPDVVYLEQLTSASYPSSPADLAYYWDMLNRLAIEADPPIASSMILDQLRKEL
jgi:Domain of unknown function (DUF5753)